MCSIFGVLDIKTDVKALRQQRYSYLNYYATVEQIGQAYGTTTMPF